jgi:hypothetical protein
MSSYSDDGWVRPEDEQWGAGVQVRLALAHPAATRELIERVLTEAQQACADSGRPAQELFGDAADYAYEVADQRIPPEERAAVDMDGIAPAEQLQAALLALGLVGLALSVLLLLVGGWRVEISPWQLVVLAAGNVAYLAATGAVLARGAGQMRRSWSLVALAAAVLVGATAAAIPLEERPPVGDLPTLLPVAVYLAVVVGAWNMPRLGRRPARRPDLPAEKWFAQLDGLLRGRYHLTRAVAARYVGEARVTWQESAAARPGDELGSPQVYAMQLMDGSPQPHRARRRSDAWVATAIAAMWTVHTGVYLWNGAEPGALTWRLVAVLVFVVLAVLAWRRHLRDERQVSGSVDA